MPSELASSAQPRQKPGWDVDRHLRVVARRRVVLALGVRKGEKVVPERKRRVVRRDLEQPLEDRDAFSALRRRAVPGDPAAQVAPGDHVERRDRDDAAGRLHRLLPQPAVEPDERRILHDRRVARREPQRGFDLGECTLVFAVEGSAANELITRWFSTNPSTTCAIALPGSGPVPARASRSPRAEASRVYETVQKVSALCVRLQADSPCGGCRHRSSETMLR